jgi:hypothetical protein
MENIEPKFEEILAAKRAYYGLTEAAIHFAAEEYARQFLLFSKYEEAHNSEGIRVHRVSYGYVCTCLKCNSTWTKAAMKPGILKCRFCGNSGEAATEVKPEPKA